MFPLDDPGLPPARCPEPGDTPVFASPSLNLIDPRLCFQYTTSATAQRGVALCQSIVGQNEVFEGPIDQPLVASQISRQLPDLVSAIINPEGTRVSTVETDPSRTVVAIETYQRAGAAWVHLAETTTFTATSFLLGTPSRGPTARLAVFDRFTKQVEELDDHGETWVSVTSYATPFGDVQPAANNSGLHQTEDGLGVLFTSDDSEPGKRRLGYADRTSIDMPFGVARAITLEASDLFQDASMSSDCTRVYVADFNGLYFVTQ